MIKCPKCGYKIDTKKRISDYEITAMMEGKSPKLKDLLRNVIRQIRNNIPSNNDKYLINNFVSKVLQYEYKTIEESMQHYLNNGYMYQGKGFNYLLKVMETICDDREKIIKNQKSRFGTSPPIVIWDGTLEDV
ncbi:MAG: hypothetical protein H8E55_08175 [Pelagibacterales bacterium]|nr:hypothetical protein [Pelagibacterales bacterium]